MNTNQGKEKKNYLPDKFFEGKELRMAHAIYDGKVGEIEKLIKTENYDVNGRGKTEERYTYLGYALRIGEVKSASKLCELGADVNLFSFEGTASIFSNIGIACDNKNQEMVELLLKYNVDLNPPLTGSPLHGLLIGDVDKSIMDLLIKKGIDVNHQNYISGGTAVFTALELSKFDYVHYLLDNGANPELVKFSGQSLAYYVQNEIDEGRLNDYGLREYKKLKQRLEIEYHVKFPLKLERKKGMEEGIKLYENLPIKYKELLGDSERKRYQAYRDSITKGVDYLGKSFTSYK